MNRYKNPIFFFCLIFLTLIVINITIGEEWRRYSINDGLINNSIWDIIEDKNGYLWFITLFDGISKYDGIRFENFNIHYGLISNNIYAKLADSKGNFWIGTDRGVNIYDGQNFFLVDTNNGLAGSSVNCIMEGSAGDIWIATDRGITTYNGKDFQIIENLTNISGKNVNFILEEDEDIFWFAIYNQAIKYDIKSSEMLSIFQFNSQIFQFYQDQSQNLWVLTESGLYQVPFNSVEIKGPFFEGSITQFLEDQKNNIWILSESNGIKRFDIDQQTFINEKPFLNIHVNILFEDSRGNLWVGTNTGIIKYDGITTTTISEINSNSLHFVRSILEDNDENIWFGSEEGVFIKSFQNLHQFTIEEGLSDNKVNIIIEDEEGILWFGTNNGLCKYIGNTFQETKILNKKVTSLFEDKQKNLWVGTDKGVYKNLTIFDNYSAIKNAAILKISGDSLGNIWIATPVSLIKYDHNNFTELPIEGITEIVCDSQGNLWVGTWDDGIYRIDKMGQQSHFTVKHGLGSEHITWILETSDGVIWFGLKGQLNPLEKNNFSSGGICKYENNQFKTYGMKDNLISIDTEMAAKDTIGNLWLVSDQGAMKYTEIDSIESEILTKSEGLISNYVKSILVDKKGNLWFGTDRGVSKYDGTNIQNISLIKELTFGSVESIFEDSNGGIWFITTNVGVFRYHQSVKKGGPRIHLRQIEADKIYKGGLQKIEIPSTANRITFEYKAISFKTPPEQLRYIYKLSGFDTDWSPSTNVTRVHYENLKPGNYQFLVKSFDHDLYYSNSPAFVNFIISDPFYKEFWFLIFVSIFLFGLFFCTAYFSIQYIKQRRIAVQYRETLRMKKEMEELQSAKMSSLRQLVAGVTHELNNPIGAISSSNDVCIRAIIKIKNLLNMEELKNKNELKQILQTLSLLETVQKSSTIASNKAAKIVENLRSFVKPDEAEWQTTNILIGIDNAINLLSTELNDKIVIKKNYADIPPLFCSPSSLNQVFICMIKNAIDAIENNGEIRITTISSKENILITIEDTGIGIPAENMKRIFDPGFTSKGVKVGVGLGLSICYKIIVDEHKGHIDVTSEVGFGTKFTITLPIHSKN